MWFEYVIKMLYLQVNCLEHVLGERPGGAHYRREWVAAMASIPRQILKSWLTPQWVGILKWLILKITSRQ